LIAALDVMGAALSARRDGLELLGAYHSHPGADASPSRTDAAESWGDWLYLIVACENGEPGDVRCWRWAGSEFVEVHIELEDDADNAANRDPR
jgi:proteasome lid subunit RPN8/RPN11